MIKHVILWALKDELGAEEKAAVKAGIKSSLEALVGQIPGLLSLRIYTDPVAGSNMDVMLDSTFESEQALQDYVVHPAHQEAANTKVRPYVKVRSCMDFAD